MDRFGKARDIRDRRKKGETIEKSRQSRMNDERLYFKFVAKYVEGLYPRIFADAVAFHKETKQKNPGVNDNTKTIEFMSRVTPNIPIPRYYNIRQNRQQQQQRQEMVLEIPLLNSEQTLTIMTTQLPVPPPVSAPSPVSVPLPVTPPVSAPSPLPVTPPVSAPSPLPVTPPVSAPLPLLVTPPVSAPLPLPELPPVPALDNEDLFSLPPEIYRDMLKEIQLDPQLSQIFNDFQEDDVGMDDLVWDDISEYNIQLGMDDLVWE